jgi:hypothetical protein
VEGGWGEGCRGATLGFPAKQATNSYVMYIFVIFLFEGGGRVARCDVGVLREAGRGAFFFCALDSTYTRIGVQLFRV